MKNIRREQYLARIRPYIDTQLIKVITGQRRVGKSYLLQQVKEEIKNRKPNSHFIEINLEKFDFRHLKTAGQLFDYLKTHEKPRQKNYLFIDEVQEIKDFERVLRHYALQENFDIYCSGSNARLLSGELATYLSGRQIEVQVHPLSFPEFLKFHQLARTQESLERYMRFGGMPYLIHLPPESDVIDEYLQNVLNTILFRDIVQHYQLRDSTFLQNLLSFLADNIGSPVSASSIAKYLKAQGYRKTVQTIIEYISHSLQTFLIREARRYDIKGKRIFETSAKYFFEDLGIRNVIAGFNIASINKIMENLVYNHLKINRYKVYVGKLNGMEIDFVAEKNNEKKYLQVCYRLHGEQTIQREFGNLLKIADNYPKILISMDAPRHAASYEGIHHLSLLDFLSTNF